MICKYHTYTYLDTKKHQFWALSAHIVVIVVQRISDKAPNFQPTTSLPFQHARHQRCQGFAYWCLTDDDFWWKKMGGCDSGWNFTKDHSSKSLCQDHFPASHVAYVYIYILPFTFSILNHFWHTWYSLFNWNQGICQRRNSWIFK